MNCGWDPGFCKFPGDVDAVSRWGTLTINSKTGSEPSSLPLLQSTLEKPLPSSSLIYLELPHLTTQPDPKPIQRGRFHQMLGRESKLTFCLRIRPTMI